MLDVAGALRVALARKAALCSVAWPRACTVPEGRGASECVLRAQGPSGLRNNQEARKEAAGKHGGVEASTQGGAGREGDREMGCWLWAPGLQPDLGSCTAVVGPGASVSLLLMGLVASPSLPGCVRIK